MVADDIRHTRDDDFAKSVRQVVAFCHRASDTQMKNIEVNAPDPAIAIAAGLSALAYSQIAKQLEAALRLHGYGRGTPSE